MSRIIDINLIIKVLNYLFINRISFFVQYTWRKIRDDNYKNFIISDSADWIDHRLS